MTNYEIKQGTKENAIEIYFTGKPEQATRDILKSYKMRWNGKKLCWYGFVNADTIAEAINNSSPKEAEALIIPPVESVDGYGLYDGWQGGNYHEWHNDQELKSLISADCKKAGIKATFRFGRGGYLTSLTATMKISANEIKSFEEWDATAEEYYPAGQWLYYTDENGKLCDIYGEKFYSLEREEFEEMKKNIRRTDYELAKKHMLESNTWSKNKFSVLKDNAAKRMDTLQAIITSYNHDCSNSMIDYFDRAIYDDYAVKVI